MLDGMKSALNTRKASFFQLVALSLLGAICSCATPDKEFAPDRNAARWVLNHGGKLCVRLADEGTRRYIEKRLPGSRFLIQTIQLEAPALFSKEGFAYLDALVELDSLCVLGDRISARELALLKNVPRLRELSLYGMSLDDKGFEQLAGLGRLTHLYLDRTNITDASLKPLKRLKDLQLLSLSGSQVTEKGIRDFSASLPECSLMKAHEPWKEGLSGHMEPGKSSSVDSNLKDRALVSLRRASEYLWNRLALEGGYLRQYNNDLPARGGHSKNSSTLVRVSGPDTARVGMAFLRAYALTGDSYYLRAAHETAYTLVKGQLISGGWQRYIELDPILRKMYAYRVDANEGGLRSIASLDNNITQSALCFLMRMDRALGFRDERIHQAVEYGFDRLLEAQYPNGAWPQKLIHPPDPRLFPIKRASYPKTWHRRRVRSFLPVWYRSYYTFNDDGIPDAIETLLEAARVYGNPRYTSSALKGGDFILLAQMPEPQPAWAQQYDLDMHPAWARRFEPPAISGRESQRVMKTLLRLYRETAKKKYLDPIPRAVDYFRRSRLPDGRLARFYELKTNRPLYLDRKYRLTYDDSDLPTHYAFKVYNGIESIAREYERVRKTPLTELQKSFEGTSPEMMDALMEKTNEIIYSLDERGAWVEKGVIKTTTFIRNVEVLCEFLATASGEEKEGRGKSLNRQKTQ